MASSPDSVVEGHGREPTARSTPVAVGAGLALAAVVLVSLNLRSGAAAVGPVLAEVRSGLDLGSAVAGALTGLPGLCFALVGLLAAGMGRRLGATRGITLGLVAVVVGLGARVVAPDAVTFLLLSTLALAGMAVGNVLAPAWIKQHGGRHQVWLVTLYGSGLTVSGTLASLLTAPLSTALGGWRQGLGVWALTALVAVPVWLLLSTRLGRDAAGSSRASGVRVSRSPTAVAMAVLFGIQSMHAYVQFGWLPQVYRDAGLSATYAGGLQALLSAMTLIGGLTMPAVIARARTLTPLVLGLAALLAGGYVGLLLAPATLPWLWAGMLGVAGFAFPLAIALLTARTRDHRVTASLSGFVQPVGYLLAALGPFGVGLLHDATGSWTLVLALLAATSVPFAIAGVRAARPVMVDDELTHVPDTAPRSGDDID